MPCLFSRTSSSSRLTCLRRGHKPSTMAQRRSLPRARARSTSIAGTLLVATPSPPCRLTHRWLPSPRAARARRTTMLPATCQLCHLLLQRCPLRLYISLHPPALQYLVPHHPAGMLRCDQRSLHRLKTQAICQKLIPGNRSVAAVVGGAGVLTSAAVRSCSPWTRSDSRALSASKSRSLSTVFSVSSRVSSC